MNSSTRSPKSRIRKNRRKGGHQQRCPCNSPKEPRAMMSLPSPPLLGPPRCFSAEKMNLRVRPNDLARRKSSSCIENSSRDVLNGKQCRNSDFALMYDNNFASLSISSVSPKSLSSAAKSFQEAFRTVPTILRKEHWAASSTTATAATTVRVDVSAVASKEAETNRKWSTCTPRSFLEAATGASSGNKMDEGGESDSSQSNAEDSLSSTSSSGGFQLIDTPDSTLTKSSFSSRETHETLSSKSSCTQNVKFDEVHDIDMPAKQLFATQNETGNKNGFGIISPPMRISRVPKEDNPGIKTCSSPWDLQSPFQLEKDNFLKETYSAGQSDNSNGKHKLFDNKALRPSLNMFVPQNTRSRQYGSHERYNHPNYQHYRAYNPYLHQSQTSIHFQHCYHGPPTFHQRNLHQAFRFGYNHHYAFQRTF